MNMETMKYVSLVVLTMLTVTLVFLLPQHVKRSATYNRSRWLMVMGLLMLTLHYVLQITLDPRLESVTFAVVVNLWCEVPTGAFMSMSAVSMQRRKGRFDKSVWLPGLVAWIVTWSVITLAALRCGSYKADTPCMRIAEYISAAAFALMQIYYITFFLIENRRMQRVLENYFDLDTRFMWIWARRSVFSLGFIVVFTPLALFGGDKVLAYFTLAIMFLIYYYVVSFICYGVAGSPQLVADAEKNAELAKMDEETPLQVESAEVHDENMQRVALAVESWITTGGPYQCDITMATVAREMGVPRDQLTRWLKTTPWELFSPWLAHLRIEHAKQLLLEHPEWTNEAVAEMSGFKSRIYFQQAFKKAMGMTPAQFSARNTCNT